jgi:hypothetical protein
MIGKRFNQLVIQSEGTTKSRKSWNCICDCGGTKEITQSDLVTGNTKSCGCLKRQPKKHGMCCNRRDASIYKRWQHMKARCLDTQNSKYKDYGGRGITICDRWLVFENYLEDVGLPPIGMQLDRIDNDKGYYK